MPDSWKQIGAHGGFGDQTVCADFLRSLPLSNNIQQRITMIPASGNADLRGWAFPRAYSPTPATPATTNTLPQCSCKKRVAMVRKAEFSFPNKTEIRIATSLYLGCRVIKLETILI
jgi:hypothetical protein